MSTAPPGIPTFHMNPAGHLSSPAHPQRSQSTGHPQAQPGTSTPTVPAPIPTQQSLPLDPSFARMEPPPPQMAHPTMPPSQAIAAYLATSEAQPARMNPASASLPDTQKQRDVLDVVCAKFGVMADLFRDFSNIITIGLRKEATPTVHLDERDSWYHDLWETLKEYYLDIVTRIASGGDNAISTTVLLLQHGRRQILAAIVDGVKKSIQDWFVFDPPLSSNRKGERGFRHMTCGLLLCPPVYDWDEEETRTGVRDNNPQYSTEPDSIRRFPRYMWQDHIYDPANPYNGFARNPLVVKAVVIILQGPNAASDVDSATGTRHFDPNSGINTRPRAASWGITEITPARIAAGATLVRFALSDQRKFAAGDAKRSKNGRLVRTGAWP